MKRHAVLCAIVATSLGLGGPAFAQGDGGPQQQGTSQLQGQRGDRHQAQRDFQQQRQQQRRDVQQQRQQQQRDWQQSQRTQRQAQRDERRDARGAGPDHDFRRGDRLPPQYRHHNYVVDDWRGHHLSAPPRGSQWVQVGGDYVLVAVATGIIMQLLLNN